MYQNYARKRKWDKLKLTCLLSFIGVVFSTLSLRAETFPSSTILEIIPQTHIPVKTAGKMPTADWFDTMPEIQFGEKESRTTIRIGSDGQQLFLYANMVAPIAAGETTIPSSNNEESLTFYFDGGNRLRRSIFICINMDNKITVGIDGGRMKNFPAISKINVTPGNWQIILAFPLEKLKTDTSSLGFNAVRKTINNRHAATAFFKGQQDNYSNPDLFTILSLLPTEKIDIAVSNNDIVVSQADAADGRFIIPDSESVDSRQLIFARGTAVLAIPDSAYSNLCWVETINNHGEKKRCPLRLRKWINPYVKPLGTIVSSNDNLSIWSAASAYKIFKDQSLPCKYQSEVLFSCAGNEYEAVQIVLTPKQKMEFTATISDFVSENLAVLPSAHFSLAKVEYVKIKVPSDLFGRPGDWPDPLIPLSSQFECPAGENTVLWLRVNVPAGTPGGIYRGQVKLNGSANSIVPIKLRVFGFSLPDVCSVKTAYGSFQMVQEFQGVKSPEDQKKFFNQMLRMFRRYRISISNSTVYAPMKYADGKYDFTEFEPQLRFIFDELKCSGVNLGFGRLQPSYRLGQEMTPDQQAERKTAYHQLLTFLSEHNWLDKCYFYDVDEPAEGQYEQVTNYLKEFHELVPGIKRLLTVNNPRKPQLEGNVDIWSPILNRFDPAYFSARQKKGEEVWWYVCTFPRYPYPANNIDSPAILPRIQSWLAEKYNIEGSLYWAVDYIGWLPGGKNIRNPWQTTMAYEPGGAPWTNGDGMLIYPVCRTPSAFPIMNEPYPTIRLEMLRDGFEDREYFALLRLARARLSTLDTTDAVMMTKKIDSALQSPCRIVTDLTQYSFSPETLESVRIEIATLLENIYQQFPEKKINPQQ